MYKNFNLTESEREEILNGHKDHGYKQPLNESIDGNNMIENEKFKNDFYFKKFSEHAHHFEKLANNLMDGVNGISLEEKWVNYLNQMKNKDFSFSTNLGVNITNDLYGKVLDYPLAEGESSDNAVGIAIVTFLKMGRTQDDIKIVKLMNIIKRYIGSDDFKVFTTKRHTEEVPSTQTTTPATDQQPMNEAREILKKTFNKFIK
jgi:tRNA U38,U39,U40 pseudouridine synthase TruA